MTEDAGPEGACLRVPARRVRWWARWGCYLAPALVYLSLTLPKLDQGGFRTDTGRYAAVGLQMWRTGELWTPYLQPDTPYFNKPPLVLWIHGLSLHALGVGVWQARLPSVLAGLGCVLVLVACVRRFGNRARALAAGLVLATTLEFFRRTKEVSIDMWQALFLLCAVWCVTVAVTRKGGRAGTAGWFALAGVGVGLGLMCKPIVALIAVPVLGVWLPAAGAWRRAGWLALTTLVALVVAGPWHAGMAAVHGEAFTGNYFGSEVADRAAGDILREPWWYYLREMGEYHWPWLIAALGGLIGWAVHFPRGFGRADRRGLLLAVVWSACWLVLLSAFPDKRPRYGLLFYPTLAWVSAIWLFDVVPPAWRRGLVRALPVIVGAVMLGGAALSMAPVRVNRPADPGYAAVGAWMRENPDRPVMIGELESNENGWLYLLSGRWAYREGDAAFPEAPADAAWVWFEHSEPRRKLPAGHEVVLRAGAARLTERSEE